MEHFTYHVPKANGQIDGTVELFMTLVPYGEENAVSRYYLTGLCLEYGLIDRNLKDKDRVMRAIMQKAKLDYAICHNGIGYFRPLPKNKHILKTCIKKERSRAYAILKGLSVMEKLYEDYESGRIEES